MAVRLGGWIGQGRERSIRSQLIRLTLACVLPAWLAAGLLVYGSYQDKRQLIEQHMQESARGMAQAVDLKLAMIQTSLQVLAQSPHLTAGNFAGFHGQILETLKGFPGADIIMADAAAQQLVNSYRPFGQPLPLRNTPETVRKIFETGQPVISGLFFGAVTKRPLISVDVPVFRNGSVVYDLAMTLPAVELARILSHQQLAEGWLGVILDRSGAVVARNISPEKFIGRLARPNLLARIGQGSEGIVEILSFEEVSQIVAFTKSTTSGWAVVVGVPKATLLNEVRNWLLLTVILAVVLALIGIGLALLVGQHIAGPVRALLAPARLLGRGEPLLPEPLALAEANEVAQELGRASTLLRQRAEERDLAEKALVERTRMLQRHYENLRALNDIATQAAATSREVLPRVLELGVRHLGLSIGILSHIQDQTYTVDHHHAPPEAGLADGMVFDLGTTYCALTLQADDVVAISHMAQSPYAGHPCYRTFGLEAYIGAPITVAGRLYGTVNFTAPRPAPRAFDEGDLEFMRLLARWIGSELERERAEHEIHLARWRAEQASRAKTDFLAMMSHEIRTPLTAIIGFSEIIRDQFFGPVENGTYLEYAADINASGKHLLEVINDILDIAKIEAGRMELTPERIEVSSLVASSLRLIQERAVRSGVTLQAQVGPSLPLLWADPRAVKQILFNLLSNAVKYTPSGGRVTVTVTEAEAEDQGLVLTVADTGIGIPADQIDRVLQPFERIDNRYSRAGGGTGLGLPLVKGLIELHHGAIRLSSMPGAGTTVTVRFPPVPEDGASPP